MKIRVGDLKRLVKEAIDDSMISKPAPGDNIKLTWDQVQQEFTEAAIAAQELYDGNIEAMQNDDGFGSDEPGVKPPEQCAWYLSYEKGTDMDQFAASLLTRPGYVLHMYDEESISSFSGGGSDMFWTGEEWEM